jgi:CRP-like cAMP-binding protein
LDDTDDIAASKTSAFKDNVGMNDFASAPKHPSGELLAFLLKPENQHYLSRFSRRSYEEKNLVSDRQTRKGGVFVVTSGRLRVYLSYEGREFTLLFLNPGDVFSLHSHAMVEAKQPSEILVADLESFSEILVHFPHLSLSAISTIGKMLSNTTHIIEDLVFRDVKSRLLRFLIESTEDKGRAGPMGIEVPFELNTEDVAMLIGSTRQSTSSLFNQLIKEGYVVRLNRKLILVKDVEALKRLRDEPPLHEGIE